MLANANYVFSFNSIFSSTLRELYLSVFYGILECLLIVKCTPDKIVMNEEIHIEYRGRTYSGSRSIRGTRKLFQTIYYNLSSKNDGHAYGAGQGSEMLNIAKRILLELVNENNRDNN